MKTSKLLRLLKWLFVLAIIGAIALVVLLPRRTAVEGWSRATPRVPNAVTTDDALKAAFADPSKPLARTAYEMLFRYAFEGFVDYRSPAGARAFYPGGRSSNGLTSDGLEGFARMFPLAAAWLAYGGSDSLPVAGRSVSVGKLLTDGLLAGTDPANAEFWGVIGDTEQRVVESADVAIGLWISREQIWSKLDGAQRERVARWLARVLEVETFDGNWELFPLAVYNSLRALGVDVTRFDERMKTRWEHFKSFYRGDGFFFDPPRGFDFYNAWSIQYELFWFDQMDPKFDPEFIRSTNAQYASFAKHLFGPRGYPMMGRSSCYRMAANAPLVTATLLSPQSVSAGEAMRALDLNTSFFVRRDALRDGAVVQGFCGENPEIVALYSGGGSCLWGLRSLMIALYLDKQMKLFDAERKPLPVEQADFEVRNATAGWTLRGDSAKRDVTLVIDANAADANPPLKRYGTTQKFAEWLLHKPMRPENTTALYGRRSYSTADQIAGCTRDDPPPSFSAR